MGSIYELVASMLSHGLPQHLGKTKLVLALWFLAMVPFQMMQTIRLVRTLVARIPDRTGSRTRTVFVRQEVRLSWDYRLFSHQRE